MAEHYLVLLDNGKPAVSTHTGYGLTVPLFTDKTVAERYARDMGSRNPGSKWQQPITYTVVPIDIPSR